MMNDIERCVERCPVVRLLPQEERIRILGLHAIEDCPDDMMQRPNGPLCPLPDVNTLNSISQATRLALLEQRSTV